MVRAATRRRTQVAQHDEYVGRMETVVFAHEPPDGIDRIGHVVELAQRARVEFAADAEILRRRHGQKDVDVMPTIVELFEHRLERSRVQHIAAIVREEIFRAHIKPFVNIRKKGCTRRPVVHPTEKKGAQNSASFSSS